jgi:PTS system mannose-specific IIC component
MLQLFGLSLSGALLLLDSTAAFQMLIAQPLFACPILGWLGGNAQLGFELGFWLQLIWLSNMPVGAAIIPEGEIGSVAAVILAIRLSDDFPQLTHFIIFMVIIYAVLVSFIGAKTVTFIRNRNQQYLQHILNKLNQGKAVTFGPIIFNALAFSAVIFFALMVSLTLVFEYGLKPLLAQMPLDIANRIGLYGKISVLGVGMGMTITLMKDRRYWMLYILGMLIGGMLIFHGAK